MDNIQRIFLLHLINHSTKQTSKYLLIIGVLFLYFALVRSALLQFFMSQGLIRAVAIKQSNPEEEDVNLRKFYKEIHYLQTRSLMYFNSDNHPRTAGLTTVASEISNCIKRQLRSCENYLDCVDDLKQK